MSTLGIASTLSAARPTTDATILIRGARQVVTLQGPARMRASVELEDAGVFRDCSVLIDRGRIVQVGSARRLDNLREARAARLVDARHLVVLPGFVDLSSGLVPEDRSAATGDAEEGQERDAWATGAALLSRKVSQELLRLGSAGSTFVRARFSLPDDLQQRARMVRQLLRVEMPADAFQVVLRLDPRWFSAGVLHGTPTRELFPPTARQHVRELFPMLMMEVAAGPLRELPPAQRFQLMRWIARERPLQVADASHLNASAFLELGLAASCLACGDVPPSAEERGRLAQWAQPWLCEAGALAAQGARSLHDLVEGIRAGMRVALATGYQAGKAGVLSPLALLALLRQQTGLSPQALLNLQIANAAHAYGVGQRMGSLEAGKEANLLLVDCDDYREIGLAVGAPRISAVVRRGRWIAGNDRVLAAEFGEP